MVNIFYRDTPYATLIGLRAQGTAAMPVTINGVTDPATGRRPVITGANAVQAADATAANFGSDIQGVGIFKIFKSPTDDGSTYKAAYIAIKNLALTGAKAGNTYFDNDGNPHAYDNFAAGIYVVKADHLLVENCEITENGLGIFTNSKGYSDIDFTSYVTLRANKFDLNGYTIDDHEHNIYVQSRRALYEGNFIGQARGGASLKDRSSGTVVRFNHIVASARALDLVETEEEYEANLQSDPLYPYAWVYGNTIVNDFSSPNGYSIRMVHWGFDNTMARGRLGTLYFFGNTVIHRGFTPYNWYTSVFQMGSDGYMPDPPVSTYKIEAWDNVFTNEGNEDGTTQWRGLWDVGTLLFRGVNYLPNGYLLKSGGTTGTVSTSGSTVLTGDATVVDHATFIPAAASAALNCGGSFTPDYSALSGVAGFTAANLARIGEFFDGTTPLARAKIVIGTIDIGAHERPSTDTTAPVLTLVSAGTPGATAATITWTTDEAADSQVVYGTSASYGSSTTLVATLATAHSLALGGLSPSTTYHFAVRSRDAAGNLATSGDRTFTTTTVADTTPPVISLISASATATAATITWTTDEAADSQVVYGTSASYGSSTTLVATLATAHSLALGGLSPSTTYHFAVRSRDAAGNLATSGDQSFSISGGTSSPTRDASGSGCGMGTAAGLFLPVLLAVRLRRRR